jgi:sugar lactone lactonase YvrE
MSTRCRRLFPRTTEVRLALASLVVLAILMPTVPSAAKAETIPFDAAHWDLTNARVIDYLGRSSLAGFATLKDTLFADGVIEVDMAVTGARSYPGIVFRAQPDPAESYERFYIRPHRAGLYTDALQYHPVYNGVESWQLYSGPGYTAGASFPHDQWFHVRLEVKGAQARVFIGDAAQPALEIPRLEHGATRGTIGLFGPPDGSAYFSNFVCQPGAELTFAPPTAVSPPEGAIVDWELSRPMKTAQADLEAYPRFYTIFYANWQPAQVNPDGLVDVSKLCGRQGQAADCIYARAIVQSDRTQDVKLAFGYSDEVSIFHNRRLIFRGNSAYRYRDPSFLGVVGLYDAVYLTLEKGRNEIFLKVSESFGGWGFRAQAEPPLAPPRRDHGRITKVWETDPVFLTPESVVYDPARQVLYVASFDNMYEMHPEPTGYISRLSLGGRILNLKWVDKLNAPTGLALRGNSLFTAEREFLTEIDTGTGDIRARYAIPGADFPNDVAVDGAGNVYISDTSPKDPRASAIYRLHDGDFETWLGHGTLDRANGLCVDRGKLLIGNTGDGFLVAADIDSRRIERVTCLAAGVLDGIRPAPSGGYLVSHWEGQLYQVNDKGEVLELMDTLPAGMNCADFEFIPEQSLVVVPTFLGNRVVAYKLH